MIEKEIVKKTVVDEITNETMDINEPVMPPTPDIQQAELSEEAKIISEEEGVLDPEPEQEEPKVETPSTRHYTPPIVEKKNTSTIQYARNGRTRISHDEANGIKK